MVEVVFEGLGLIVELFGGFGWPGFIVILVCAVLAAAVYGGSQSELADVQACQAKGPCAITTDPGPFHTRHLVQVAPARPASTTAASVPSITK